MKTISGLIIAFSILTALLGQVNAQTSTSVLPAAVCPPLYTKHWDKIIFIVNDSKIAQAAKPPIPANTELDIKVPDDPTKVADIKAKVFSFLNVPQELQNRSLLKILDVDYAIICSSAISSHE